MTKRGTETDGDPPKARADWAEIRRDYEDLSVPIAETAAKAGISQQKLIYYARGAGWKMRTVAPEARPTEELTGAALKPSSLAARLKRLIAREIEAIEGEATSKRDAAAKERDARRLSSLVRSLEKLKDMKASKAKGPKDAGQEEDGDALRDELQRRLARIRAGSGDPRVPPEPERAGSGMAR